MEETQLTQKYKEGDREAMEEIFEQYYSRVIATVSRILSYNMREDVTQDVFMEIFKSHKNFQEKCSLSTWIYRITLNKSLLIRNKLKKSLYLSLDELKIPIKGRDNLEKDIINKEEISHLNKSINKLSGKQKKVVILRTYEQLPYKQIANILEITENNAKSTHFKAVEKLRKLFYKGAPHG